MRIFGFFVMSLFLAALSFGQGAFAADKQSTGSDASLVWEMSFKHPGAEMTISVAYPQGFGQEADATLGAFAKKQFDEAFEPFRSFIAEKAEEVRVQVSQTGKLPEEAAGGSWFSKFTYSVENPSPAFVSVVFDKEEYTGGAHGNRGTFVFSFNKETGKPLALTDVFTDVDKAVSELVPLVAKAVQAAKDKDAEPVAADAKTLDLKMERMALTANGLRVYYAPYEVGSYAEGEFTAEIPKEQLVQLGANPAIWGGK
ncbi:DUF3298 and DUF4163 domain-containing protein [Desulfovibrio sp. OttesenSCG-928-G15]|nr:DUF3298 and DUF4163 domain-containing protein [Desulfovibrio sp. OttesenSCG-928-G15]